MPQVYFFSDKRIKDHHTLILKITLDTPPQLINMLHNTPQTCPKFKVGIFPHGKNFTNFPCGKVHSYAYASLQTQEPQEPPTFMDPSDNGSGILCLIPTHSMPVASLNAIVADEEGGVKSKGSIKDKSK
jgi:hypothetical protein